LTSDLVTANPSEAKPIPFGFDSKNETQYSGSGALGLAPAFSSSFPSFVNSLYDDDKIAEKLVSWSIVSDELEASDNSSLVTFGAGIADAYNGNLFSHNSS
jgi:hypothetical protein